MIFADVKYFAAHWVGGAVVALALAGVAYGAWLWTRPPVDTTVAVIAPPAPVIAKVKKKVIPVKQVVVYAEEAKANLKLPPSVIASESQHVTGATTVQPSERRITVTSVMDEKTGETTTYTKPEPYPWVAVESRGEVRFDYGYKIDVRTRVPQQVGRLSIVHDVLQVKGVHLGVVASVFTDGTAFAGVGLGYRW
ncbi:MAG: hypothetical protein Q8R92_16995 [Deltaproteobacteria bacterium]|nr:hypothetical protein [Deltaproteobacteria bacterium]